MMKKRVIHESSDSEEEEIPLAKRAKADGPSLPAQSNGTTVKTELTQSLPTDKPGQEFKRTASSSSDDEEPLASRAVSARSHSPTASTSAAATSKRVSSESSDDDAPLHKVANGNVKGAKAKKAKSTQQTAGDEYGTSDEDIKPKMQKLKEATKPRKSKNKAENDGSAPKPKKVKRVKKEEEEAASEGGTPEGDELDEKWWNGKEVKSDGTIKWKTLAHNGILFPPPYVPHGVMMKYDGRPVKLDADAEEVASFFGSMLATEHVEKEVFRNNFFADFLQVLKDHPPLDGARITEFSKCDFTPIAEWAEEERVKKKGLTKDQKKQIKEAKMALEEPFQYCLLDGRKEKVGNFRIEPPGLFRGRGKHPKTGMLKKRVRPEQITINIGEDSDVPEPPPGHRWGKVIHDNTVTWLASWNENINGAFKYVYLAAGSKLKGQSDLLKYEKARKLKDHIDQIRRDYRNDLNNKVMADRQLATALYLIDLFALRAGNEKGDDEADTVGCCSLRCEHVTLSPPEHVQFDFLGKDSIRYLNDVDVDPQVHKNLRIFKKNKDDADLLFDRLNTTTLNKHLGGYMLGLSAKVFRTFNASITMQNELDKTNPKDSVADKILAYNRANRTVAILCNHQKTVSKTHGVAMDKMRDKHRALKYQRMKLRHTLFTMDSSYKKKSAYKDDESDVDDEWIKAHEEDVAEKEKEKAKKKWEKENEKLKGEGEREQSQKVLDDRYAEIDDDLERWEEERRTKRVEAKRSQTIDKVIAAIEKMDDRIKIHITQTTDKDEGKTTSLGTSKLNYLDPRITYAWCAKYEVPIEKMFAKTLREKFTWAADVTGDWRF